MSTPTATPRTSCVIEMPPVNPPRTTPTATPRTDAALLSSDCAWNCGHTFKLLIEEKYDQGKCVCTGPDIAWGNAGVVVLANFARQLETELTAARSERDLAITRVASILWSGAIDKHTCGDVQKWVEDYTAELTRLRAEVERLKKQIKDDNRSYGCELRDPNGTIWEQAAKDHARAERAEVEVEQLKADVTRETTVCDTACMEAQRLRAELKELSQVYELNKVSIDELDADRARAERAEAELANEKARLDWLDMNRRLEHGNCDRSSRSWYLLIVPTGYDYYKGGVDLPLRAAIDAAMKP